MDLEAEFKKMNTHQIHEYKYCTDDFLGKGAFGDVYLCNKTGTNDKFAIKVITKIEPDYEKTRKKFQSPKSVEEEKRILRMLNHKNVLYVFDMYEDDINHYIITGAYTGGSLNDNLKKRDYNEEEASYFIKQILEGL